MWKWIRDGHSVMRDTKICWKHCRVSCLVNKNGHSVWILYDTSQRACDFRIDQLIGLNSHLTSKSPVTFCLICTRATKWCTAKQVNFAANLFACFMFLFCELEIIGSGNFKKYNENSLLLSFSNLQICGNFNFANLDHLQN